MARNESLYALFVVSSHCSFSWRREGFPVVSMMASTCKTMRPLVAIVATFAVVLGACVRPVAAEAFSKAAYADALDKSILYFDLQRSGPLPNWQRLTWRASSGLNDGHQENASVAMLFLHPDVYFWWFDLLGIQ